ncbi:MAG: SusC/RagA family TonB-linked outer membrane protein [Paludibacter sp.]|nr:SusC/RagA family TonB-linked outer membrane protein [Paludibacter sp.]MDD4427833.1 SusC/RagA family TonB-linked outer membrane protein [Paludibacter sp.]
MKKNNLKIITLFVLVVLCIPTVVFAQNYTLADSSIIDIKDSNPDKYVLNDTVNIAFGKTLRQNLVGATSYINTDAITKIDNVQLISEALIGRIPGLFGSNNIRGIGNALFIVDGLPRDISNINFMEVEQITVLKDINSSILYGSAGVNGVVLITTKRGKINEKKINVTGYYGISTPAALPEYLSSAEYMNLYNEARLNDGLPKLYDDALIQNYSNGSNQYKYPDVDYYSGEYLKMIKPFFKTVAEFSGGNNVAKYYTNVGWEQEGSYLNFGEGENSQLNKFNVRGNVDLRINSFIKTAFDAVAVIVNNRGPISDYWKDASTYKPNLFSPLLPINNVIDSIKNNLLSSRKNDVDGKFIPGGTNTYLTNPISNTYFGGENANIQNYLSFNNRIDVDLNKVLRGLTFHTNLSFDYLTQYNQYIQNTYAVYEPTWGVNDSIVGLVKYGNDTRPGVQSIGDASYQRRIGFYGSFDYNRTFDEIHQVTASLLGMGNIHKVVSDFQSIKNFNLGLRLNYVYDKKYMIDFSSSYDNSTKLPQNAKWAFSPSIGLAWMLSEEEFMSSVETLDYLKLRVSGGIRNSDAGINEFFYYLNPYSYYGYYSWNESAWVTQGVRSTYGGNPNLGYEKRKELNVGVEGSILNNMLSFDANIFSNLYSDQITQIQTMYPSFYVDFIPYMNYNTDAYRGAEVGLTFNRKFGDFRVIIGANALYSTSEVMKMDEVYDNDYQYRKGRSVDALFGLVADGFFEDENDVSNHDFQAFGEVKPGDIKYVDQNNDGIIDTNDEVQIGRSQAPFSYGLNLQLSYKSFSLYAIGNGRVGADSYIKGDYYWIDGDKKYSEFVLNRWTEDTKTDATYPRLTTMTSTNNFRNSTFWLYRDDYFTLQRAQLNYEFPKSIKNALLMKDLSCFLAASNLFTLSKHSEIKDLRIGNEPYSRSFVLGLKIMF